MCTRGAQRKFEQAGNQISKLENRSIEIIQFEEQQQKH